MLVVRLGVEVEHVQAGGLIPGVLHPGGEGLTQGGTDQGDHFGVDVNLHNTDLISPFLVFWENRRRDPPVRLRRGYFRGPRGETGPERPVLKLCHYNPKTALRSSISRHWDIGPAGRRRGKAPLCQHYDEYLLILHPFYIAFTRQSIA